MGGAATTQRAKNALSGAGGPLHGAGAARDKDAESRSEVAVFENPGRTPPRPKTGVIQSDAGRIIRHDLVIPLKETAMFTSDRDQVLWERLNRHPPLRTRVESRLEVVENAAGDGEKADAVGRRVIEERRPMGHEARTAWAERGLEKGVGVAQAESDGRPGGKQTVWGHDLRAD